VTDSEIQTLVSRLPQVQRDIARQKINQALSLGWVGIMLDPPEGAMPHHYDLFGVHPVAGRMRLLPEVSDVKE
jgi:hypothetical protein